MHMQDQIDHWLQASAALQQKAASWLQPTSQTASDQVCSIKQLTSDTVQGAVSWCPASHFPCTVQGTHDTTAGSAADVFCMAFRELWLEMQQHNAHLSLPTCRCAAYVLAQHRNSYRTATAQHGYHVCFAGQGE